MSALVLSRYVPGGQVNNQALACDLDEALVRAWEFDAHIVQYDAPAIPGRLNKEHIAKQPMFMRFAMFDYDAPNHESVELHPDWLCDALARLPEGCQAYVTAGGFRVLFDLPEAFTVNDPESWEAWRAMHAGYRLALDELLGVEGDPKCDDPGRIFRLPNVKREGDKPCYPELYGTRGLPGIYPKTVAPKAAEDVSTSEARTTLLGDIFHSQEWIRDDDGTKLTVRCPWAHEHSEGQDDLAVVYGTPDGLGKFYCGHTHCNGRTTSDVLEALKSPAVDALVDQWSGAPDRVPKAPSGQPEQSGAIATLTEVLETVIPPLEWVCEGLRLSAGRPNFIVAGPNAGKSWSIQTMAVELATGLPVFGHFPCTPSPVMFVTQDSCHIATAERFQEICKSLRVTEAPVFWWRTPVRCVQLNGGRPKFNPAGLAPLLAACRERQCKVLFLDSLFALTEGLDPNSTDIGAAIRATNFTDICTIWTHHTPKANEDFFGSQSIGAAMGCRWHVTLSDPEDDASPRLWVCKKKPERIRASKPGDFHTEWQDFSRVVWVAPPEPKNPADSPYFIGLAETRDKIRHELLVALDGGVARTSAWLIGTSKQPEAGIVKVASYPTRRRILQSMCPLELILTPDGKYMRSIGI